jgi:hypothetical protein
MLVTTAVRLTRICVEVDTFALAFGITCLRSRSIDTGARDSASAAFAAPAPHANRASCAATPQCAASSGPRASVATSFPTTSGHCTPIDQLIGSPQRNRSKSVNAQQEAGLSISSNITVQQCQAVTQQQQQQQRQQHKKRAGVGSFLANRATETTAKRRTSRRTRWKIRVARFAARSLPDARHNKDTDAAVVCAYHHHSHHHQEEGK